MIPTGLAYLIAFSTLISYGVALAVLCGIAYNYLAIVATLRFRLARRATPSTAFTPPVSILKPIRGRDARFYEAIRSHALQRYPNFEILFGATDPHDPALEDVARLQREFSSLPIRIVIVPPNDAANAKVGSLEVLACEAAHPILIVNDGDILVAPDYLTRVISLLEDPGVGLVTALYRGRGTSLAARAEALGIATEFAPSVLVARLRFALGSTMAFRSTDLQAIGGFATIRDYLADDYQLGARIFALGKRIVMADTVVETNLGAATWREVWKHQVRWSRTIRICQPAGYFGYIVTQATFWCLIAALLGYPLLAAAGIVVRLLAAVAAMFALNFPFSVLAVLLRDLFGLAVWAAGMVGNTVEWRGLKFRLHESGRIEPL